MNQNSTNWHQTVIRHVLLCKSNKTIQQRLKWIRFNFVLIFSLKEAPLIEFIEVAIQHQRASVVSWIIITTSFM